MRTILRCKWCNAPMMKTRGGYQCSECIFRVKIVDMPERVLSNQIPKEEYETQGWKEGKKTTA